MGTDKVYIRENICHNPTIRMTTIPYGAHKDRRDMWNQAMHAEVINSRTQSFDT